jgi:hypothetical protein
MAGDRTTRITILLVAVLATLALAWVYVNLGLKFLAPGLLILGVLALMLFFRDVKTPFFYLLVIALPIFIAKYLMPVPDVEHPGILNVPVLYSYEVPLYLFIFLWFIEFIAGRGTGLRVPRTTAALALLFVPAIFSTFFALDASYGAYELLRMFEMFLFFLVVANYLKTDRQLKIVLIILGVDVAVQSVVAVMQFLNPWGMYELLEKFGIYMGISHAVPYESASPIRACGTTGYCNYMAGFFELTLPLFASLFFFYPMSKSLKRAIVVLLALSLVALLTTFSRGGLAAMVVAAIALLAIGVRRFPELGRHALRVSAVVGVQLAIIFALLSEKLFMRIRFFMATMEDEVRIALMRNAFEMIKHNPYLAPDNVGARASRLRGVRAFHDLHTLRRPAGRTRDLAPPRRHRRRLERGPGRLVRAQPRRAVVPDLARQPHHVYIRSSGLSDDNAPPLGRRPRCRITRRAREPFEVGRAPRALIFYHEPPEPAFA